MKKLLLVLLSTLSIFPAAILSQNVWLNTAPDAIIKKLTIIPDNEPPGNLSDPLNIYVGIVNIIWNNGLSSTGQLRRIDNSLLFEGLRFADQSYEYFATYYCNANSSDVMINTCYGIALKLVDGKLCVAGYQYNPLATNLIFSLFDYGCFLNSKLLDTRPTKLEIGFLQKFTKEELIDMLLGKKPIPDWPRGPVCLSCPPWPEFNKDLELKLKNFKVKKYQFTWKEIK